MTKEPENLFLLDALGATISAFFLGVILTSFEPLFGMPVSVLYILASVACLLAVYSFTCFFHQPENRRLFLRIIAIANLLYCCLTLVLVIYFYEALTVFGVAYFIGEMLLILLLVSLEFRTANLPTI